MTDKRRLEILEAELSFSAKVWGKEVAILLDELEENGYESDQFEKIKKLKLHAVEILEKIEKLKDKECQDDRHTDI